MREGQARQQASSLNTTRHFPKSWPSGERARAPLDWVREARYWVSEGERMCLGGKPSACPVPPPFSLFDLTSISTQDSPPPPPPPPPPALLPARPSPISHLYWRVERKYWNAWAVGARGPRILGMKAKIMRQSPLRFSALQRSLVTRCASITNTTQT